eukprot:g4724.t1
MSKWRIVRVMHLWDMYTEPGGHYFDLWEFAREFGETFLQILAVQEYADNGVHRIFLDVYIFVIFINSFSGIALMMPKLVLKQQRGGTGNTRKTLAEGRRERVLLMLDVFCDFCYSIFPTIYLVAMILLILFGSLGHDLCVTLRLRLEDQGCRDVQGFVILPIMVEMLFGGSTAAKILLKLVTRLSPLWFSASRAVEVVQAMAVAREAAAATAATAGGGGLPPATTAASRGNPTTFEDKDKDKDKDDSNDKGDDAVQQVEAGSFFVRKIVQERVDHESGRPPIRVPLWMSASLVAINWAFCVFAWARFAELAAPCHAAETPWNTNCVLPSHPLFDFAIPGSGRGTPGGHGLCACNTFIAAPDNRTYVSPAGSSSSSTAGTTNSSMSSKNSSSTTLLRYDCSAPQFMEDVYGSLFAGGSGQAGGAAAPYVQTILLRSGCAVNNTHITKMFTELPKLRVIEVRDSRAIVPPLVIPPEALHEESQLMAVTFAGMSIDKIPPTIGSLRSTLTILVIDRNPDITAVPASLGECTGLTFPVIGTAGTATGGE